MNEEIHLPRTSGSIEDKGRRCSKRQKDKGTRESKKARAFCGGPQVREKGIGDEDGLLKNIGGIKGILRDCFVCFLSLNLKELEDKNVIGFYTSFEDVTFMLVSLIILVPK
jgi:hypothetical protein